MDSNGSMPGAHQDDGMRGAAMRTPPGTAMPGRAMSGSGSTPDGDGAMPGGTSSSAMSGSGAGRGLGMVGGAGGASGSGPGDSGGRTPSRRSCGTMDVHRRLLATSAEYRQARAQLEEFTRARSLRAEPGRSSGVVRIPIVVHVVWQTADQNISDEQVRSQIDVLNEDFRARNADLSTVPAPFQGLVADARIEFALASTDPAGNPTSGIVRRQTTVASFGADDAIKAAATGGADPWPSDRYLNLWVGELGGGLLGYAQFPGGAAATDGVVVLNTACGRTGTAAAPFGLGRTATHEVGHFLNLYHIWGDDFQGCDGTDEVDDTPNQGGANTGMPTFPHVSCNNAPDGDLFCNYMDYTDDAGMTMFTHGQVTRMEACLDGVRASLPGPASAGQPVPPGPVVSWSADRIDAFVLGTDRAAYHKWWDGAAWGPSLTDYEYQGGICMSAPEVASWAPGRLDAFVLGTDRAVYHKWWDGSTWGPSLTDYEYMGGVCLSPPRVATWGADRLDLFVLGTDRALHHKWWDGAAWGPSVTGYESLGGVCMSPPEVVSWGTDRLDVFVLGTDNAIYHKWWDGAAWGPSTTDYEYLGGICASPPTAVAWGKDRLDLFVLGTDGALYHKWWDGAAWGPSVTGWEHLGGICTSQPAVVSWGPDRLDVFVTGTDSALYHKWWDGTAWGPSATGWEYMGGVCVDRPRVTSWGSDRLDVFVVGTDSALYHKWWDGAAWGPSVTGYEYQGGIVSDFRAALDITPSPRPPSSGISPAPVPTRAGKR